MKHASLKKIVATDMALMLGLMLLLALSPNLLAQIKYNNSKELVFMGHFERGIKHIE